jgi:hypothetical protein
MARQKIDPAGLLKIINEHMGLLNECRNLKVLQVIADPNRTHGGNWTTAGLRRSGDDNDQVECDDAIAQFMADLQQKYDIQ